MNQDLSSFLRRDTVCASGSFILITEVDLIDAGFMVTHLMADQLRIGNGVCLITTARTYQHYQQVGSKIGINLKSFEEKGQFTILELLKNEYEDLKTLAVDDNRSTLMTLKNVYLKLKEKLAKLISDMTLSYLILVDDLSIWLNIGIPIQDIVTFVQYCRTLIASNSPLGCLGALAYRDFTEEDGDHTTLCRLLMHSCNLNIQVAPLMSGYSKDIHGEVRFLKMMLTV